MLDFFVAAYQENPAATLEVFVHKAESLAEDYKIGTRSYGTRPMFTAVPLSQRDRIWVVSSPFSGG